MLRTAAVTVFDADSLIGKDPLRTIVSSYLSSLSPYLRDDRVTLLVCAQAYDSDSGQFVCGIALVSIFKLTFPLTIIDWSTLNRSALKNCWVDC